MSNKNDSLGLVATLVAAALSMSCNVQSGSETGSTAERAPTRPAETERTAVPRARLAASPADIESTGAPPSAEAVARSAELTKRLSDAIARAPGTRLAFVDCSQAVCSARLSAPTLEALKEALQGVSLDQQGRVGFVAREHLDAYLGHTFEADLELETDATRQIPEDPGQLLDDDASGDSR